MREKEYIQGSQKTGYLTEMGQINQCPEKQSPDNTVGSGALLEGCIQTKFSIDRIKLS